MARRSPVMNMDIGNNVYGRIGVDGGFDNPSKLQGMYRGRVEWNQDDKNQGRVKVRVPEIHGLRDSEDGVSTESLPYAQMVNNSSGAGYGSFIVPEVGEYVMVSFENGDIYHPIVMGSSYGAGPMHEKEYGSGTDPSDEKWASTKGQAEVPPENARIVPSLKTIYKSPIGSVISMDEQRGSENILIQDGLGQKIAIHTNMTDDCVRKGPEADRKSDGTSIEIVDYGGQSLTFTSSKDSCDILLKSADGFEMHIDPSDDGFHIKADEAYVHLTKDGDVYIKGKKVVIESEKSKMNIGSSVRINAPGSVRIKSGGSMTLQGSSVKVARRVRIVD